MSEMALKSIIRGALRSAGFRGYRASVHYRGGRATVKVNGACTGIYDVLGGCFIS